MTISTLGWIFLGVAAWLVVATVVGVLIGRMIRLRDRQTPLDDSTTHVRGIPAQGSDPDPDGSRSRRVAGWGRRQS